MNAGRIALLLCVVFLCACEGKAVLDCAAPTSIVIADGLKIGGNLSVKSARGVIDASLGRDLKADFAKSDPNSWISIAATYQYQICQSLNSTSCDDLPKSECLSKKKEILNEAFDKINLQLKEERERQDAAKAKQATLRIDSCIAKMVSDYESDKKASTEGGARAAAPGFAGGRNTDIRDVCYAAGPNQRIVSATTASLSCHGGRCSVTAPVIEDDYKKVCVRTTAWSESKSYGGGGSAKYRLDIVYKNVATPEVVNQMRAVCGSER